MEAPWLQFNVRWEIAWVPGVIGDLVRIGRGSLGATIGLTRRIEHALANVAVGFC